MGWDLLSEFSWFSGENGETTTTQATPSSSNRPFVRGLTMPPMENEDEPVDVQRMGFSIYSHPRDTEEFCPDVEPDDTIYHHI